MPIENGKNMTGPQHIGSARTYGMRYAFCNAFGIMTCDEDDDGNAERNITPSHKTDKLPSGKTAPLQKTPMPDDCKAMYACIMSSMQAKEKGVALFTDADKKAIKGRADAKGITLEALTAINAETNQEANKRRALMQAK
jgi:hypothetical protein